MNTLSAEDWANRLAALRDRGLSVKVSDAIAHARDVGSLLQLEQLASDEDLVELSRLWAEREGLHERVRLARPVDTEWVPSTHTCWACKAAGR